MIENTFLTGKLFDNRWRTLLFSSNLQSYKQFNHQWEGDKRHEWVSAYVIPSEVCVNSVALWDAESLVEVSFLTLEPARYK